MAQKDFRDLKNKVFGRLTVLQLDTSTKSRRSNWICLCECGAQKVIPARGLIRGTSKSCGCLLKESQQKIREKAFTHRLSKTPVYRLWKGLRQRCFNPNSLAFHNYGGRGITLCEEWKNSAESFCEWALENGYQSGLSIDRIDVDGNYEPNNCRFVDRSVQNNNRRDNIYVNYENERITIKQLADRTGVEYRVLLSRYNRNPSIKVEDLIKESGYYTVINKTRGSRHYKATLTENQVREIKILLARKMMSQVEISKQFGVSTGIVNCIAKNRSWKHVTI